MAETTERLSTSEPPLELHMEPGVARDGRPPMDYESPAGNASAFSDATFFARVALRASGFGDGPRNANYVKTVHAGAAVGETPHQTYLGRAGTLRRNSSCGRKPWC
jgi:hypothetical protein